MVAKPRPVKRELHWEGSQVCRSRIQVEFQEMTILLRFYLEMLCVALFLSANL